MQNKTAAAAENKIIQFDRPAGFFYNVAQRLMDGGKYIGALSSIRRAVEMEPDNEDYSLCLAEVLTELTRYEESNRVIFSLVERNEDCNADCFFCLGCNFMGLNDIPKAEESFEKYLELDPEGDYRDEALDFLYFFETDGHEDPELFEESDDYRLADEGKKKLDAGDYDGAIETLNKISWDNDEMVYSKNNLALAYYCKKDLQQSMEITKRVLSLSPNNLHANCNMAIFHKDSNEPALAEQHIRAAMTQQYVAAEDIYKIAVTLCELKMHDDAIKILRDLTEYNPYDEKTLFYLAAAYNNTKRFKEALNLLDDIKKLDYPGVIADYYIRAINNSIKHPGEYHEMDYVYQVPADEARRKIKYLNECLKLSDASFLELWKKDLNFMGTVLWWLEYGDDNIKRAIAGMVAGFADKKAEKVLKDFLLKKNQPDSVKNDIFVLLKRMSAKEPFIAYINDEVVEVKVGAYSTDGQDMSDEYTRLFRLLYRIIDKYYPDEVLHTLMDVVQVYLENPSVQLSAKIINETAAAILFIALEKCGHTMKFDDVCRQAGAKIDIARSLIDNIKWNGKI